MTTVTQPDTDQSSRMTALAALYAAERQDGVNGLTVTLALLAAVATYIAAVLAFGRDISHPYFWLVAPWPVWAAYSVQLMILVLQATRAKSIFILEGRLVKGAGLTKIEHADIGYVAGERVMNLRLQPKPLWVNNVFAYVLEFVTIVAFTIYCGVQFINNTVSQWWALVPSLGGILWLGIVAYALTYISKLFGAAYEYRTSLIS